MRNDLKTLSNTLDKIGQKKAAFSVSNIIIKNSSTGLQKIKISSERINKVDQEKNNTLVGYKLLITPVYNGKDGQTQTIEYYYNGGAKLLPAGGKQPQQILNNIIGSTNITYGMFILELIDGKSGFDFGINIEY
jgi:hypothetical protein